jgi:hypothetical protein
MAEADCDVEVAVDADTKEGRQKRKVNYTEREKSVMTDFFERHEETLTCKQSNTITNQAKHTLWKELAVEITCMGSSVRTVKEIKSKWKAMNGVAKSIFCDTKITCMGQTCSMERVGS